MKKNAKPQLLRRLYVLLCLALLLALGGSRKAPGSMTSIDLYNAGADPISTRQSSEGM